MDSAAKLERFPVRLSRSESIGLSTAGLPALHFDLGLSQATLQPATSRAGHPKTPRVPTQPVTNNREELDQFLSNHSKKYPIQISVISMPTWTEESMQQALQAVENGLSQYKAAKQYSIPYSTL
jgi:hypothetical protein